MNLAQEFFDLFQGLNRAYGRFNIEKAPKENKGKVEGKAFTVQGMPTVELWEKHLKGEQGIGIVPIRDDGTCRFAAIDIDFYDNLDFSELEKKITSYNLPIFICQSKSGGAHLYMFFAEDIPAKDVKVKFAQITAAIGYIDAEIFPKQNNLASQNDVGNWINMPYFGVPLSSRACFVDGDFIDEESFIEKAQKSKVTRKEFEAISLSKLGEEFEDAPPCIKSIISFGLGQGARNNGLFDIGVFVRLKHKEDWKGRLQKINETYLKPPLPQGEVQTIYKQLTTKGYFYKCGQAPIINFCDKASCKKTPFGIGSSGEECGGAAPTFNIGSFVKIETNPPIWILEIEGTRVELMTEELFLYDGFRKVCMERLNILPPAMKRDRWERMVQERLRTVEIVSAPPDASPEGQLWHYVEDFCTNRAKAREQAELLMGKPWISEGKVYFRSTDLMRYLEQQKVKGLKERQVWNILRNKGAEHKQFHIKGKCVQCWALQAFQEQVEDFDIPEISIDDEEYTD